MTHTLPQLPYDYSALEPYIDTQTMQIHHDKHHQAYVDKLNAALKDQPDLQNKSLEEILSNLEAVPEAIRTAVRNNGGGHWNHSFFWLLLRAGKENNQPEEALLDAINKKFASFENFKKEFAAAAVSRFGSGWAWLVNPSAGSGLEIVSTPNQDSPVIDRSGTPILGLDVWEHSYYLKYQYRRTEYVEAFWNIVNWEQVASNLG